MKLYKTYDSDGLIRIEDDGGSALTALKRGGVASVLSLFVPGGDRREGVGTALMEAKRARRRGRMLPRYRPVRKKW